MDGDSDWNRLVSDGVLSAPRVRPSLGVVHSLCGALGPVSELGQMVVGGAH